jgi:hypothetical protein
MAIDPADTSDLRLPDELQFVAEQLAEDADHLERTFPANAPRNWRRAFAVAVAQKVQSPRRTRRAAAVDDPSRSKRVFSSVAAAAAILVLAGLYSMNSRSGPAGRGGPAGGNHAGLDSVQTGRIVPAGVMPGISGLGALLRTESPRRPAAVPPIGADYFNKMFSGPEQEAVIDFFQEHRIPEPSVRY